MTFENRTSIETTVAAWAVATAMAGAAHAADLPSRKGTPIYAPPPAFSWTGFYAGLNVGGGFSVDGSLARKNWGKGDGVVGGGQLGYNYQLTPLFVVGVENDFQGSSLSSRDGRSNAEVNLPWFGTARGRAGLALLESRLLVYGTGGMAFGQVNDVGDGRLRIGWTAGGGVEYAFLPNWSAKVEYLYADIYKDLKSDGLADRHAKLHTVRVGVNYHFDLFSSARTISH